MRFGRGFGKGRAMDFGPLTVKDPFAQAARENAITRTGPQDEGPVFDLQKMLEEQAIKAAIEAANRKALEKEEAARLATSTTEEAVTEEAATTEAVEAAATTTESGEEVEATTTDELNYVADAVRVLEDEAEESIKELEMVRIYDKLLGNEEG